MRFRRLRWPRALTLALLAAHCGLAAAAPYPALPADTRADLSYFDAQGRRHEGSPALARMAHDADLVVWCAGNQFLAIPDAVAAFQALHPGARIGVITMPPELELRAIQAGGWRLRGRAYPGTPDIYGSISLDDLRATRRVSEYVRYAHNELQLLVARGNPRRVVDLHDLTRPELRVLLPNPLDEGIMKIYGEPILRSLGLWDQLVGGDPCRDCDRAGHVHFARVHHREAPRGVSQGGADVALVWSTEVEEAVRGGAAVEGIALPPEQSGRDLVTYFAGSLAHGPHETLARDFLMWLVGPGGQKVYTGHGFAAIGASEGMVQSLAVTRASR
jgi:hypothetical protein